MTILRNPNHIATAEMADLLETYNALTGNAVERFESRAVAERRTEMAMLAARDAAGHAGVPRGVEPEVKTVAELATPFNVMVQQLSVVAEPKRVREIKARELIARPLRKPADKIRATFTGKSKLQVNSIRGPLPLYILKLTILLLITTSPFLSYLTISYTHLPAH